MTKRDVDVDVDVDRLWSRFHAVVNMTSEHLRGFLLAEAAGDDGAFPDRPDLGLDPDGRAVLAVLAKRKADLTRDDLDLMERVVEQVSNLLVAGEAAGRNGPNLGGPGLAGAGLDDAQWRRDLMSLGHDPLRDQLP